MLMLLCTAYDFCYCMDVVIWNKQWHVVYAWQRWD